MIVPGSNLLGLARKVIGFQRATLYRWSSLTEGADGANTPTYQPPQPITASIQAVPRMMYESLGLDLQRNYITVYTNVPLHDNDRDQCGDLIDYGGRRYLVESNTDWLNQDGWAGSICCDQGPAP